MTAKLNYEDATGQVRGTTVAPLAECVKNSSRRRIVKALEVALNEFVILDECEPQKGLADMLNEASRTLLALRTNLK